MQAPEKSQFDSWIAPPGAEGDLRVPASAGKRDCARVPLLFACPLAPRADDAHLRVELHVWVRPICRRLWRLVERPLLPHPGLIARHPDCFAGCLQLATVVLRARQAAVCDHVVAQTDIAWMAMLSPVTGEAAITVVCKDDRQHRPPCFLHLFALGHHDHAVLDRARTGELQSRRPLDVDKAGAASGIGLQPVDVAEIRGVNAVLLQYLDERSARLRLDRPAINRDADHIPTCTQKCGPRLSAPRR